MSKFYLQVDKTTNVITDAIEYPYGDYVEIEVEQLPAGVMGGWYKLENGKIVEYPDLKPKTTDDKIAEMNENQLTIMEALADIYAAIATTT